EGQQRDEAAVGAHLQVVGAADGVARGERPERVVVVVQGGADLLEVVDAGDAVGRLTGPLHGGQEEGDQDADEGEDGQQFHKRNGGALHGSLLARTPSAETELKGEDQPGERGNPGRLARENPSAPRPARRGTLSGRPPPGDPERKSVSRTPF